MAGTDAATEELRFWAKVNKQEPLTSHAPELGPCWVWTGAKGAWGYGRLTVKAQRKLAHRFSFEIANGPIPKGMFVLHRCDNPSCVRPDHLRMGTPKENTQDMYVRRRAALMGPKGESNSHAKLTEAQVIQIRNRFSRGELIVRMAAEFGMDVTSVSKIVNGRSWRHVGGPTRKPGQIGRRPRKAA